MKFMDVDQYGAPLCGASFLANAHAKKCEMEQRAILRVLTVKGLKALEIEIDLTSVYGDEAFQISARKKWRTRFLQRTAELGNAAR
jgi:hypothetical protein